jgi:hypothetical protein
MNLTCHIPILSLVLIGVVGWIKNNAENADVNHDPLRHLAAILFALLLQEGNKECLKINSSS